MSGRKNISPNTNQSYPSEFNPNLATPLARPVNYGNSRHLPSAYVGDNQPPQALNVTPTNNRSGTGGYEPYPLITNVNTVPGFIPNPDEEVPHVSNGDVQAQVEPRIINQQRISNATRLEREAADRRMMENIGNMFAQRREAQRRAAERRQSQRAAQNQQPVNPETPPGTPPPERNNENGPPYRPRTPPGSPSNITDITITDHLHNSEPEPMRRRRSQGPVRTTRPQSGPRQLTRARRAPPRGGKGKTKKNKNTKKSKKTKKNKKNKNKTKRKTIRRRK